MSVVSNISETPERASSSGLDVWLNRLLLLTIVAALFGQPNALFVYFPAYPAVLTAAIFFLFGVIAYDKAKTKRLSLPSANLTTPTLLFFAYSLFSLTYAPDPFYGARILLSSIFKFFLFFAILAAITREEDFKKILLVVSVLGGLFSLQGLLYVIGFVFFNLQPGEYITSVAGYGTRNYNPGINSLGLLGFAKATNQIGSFRLPRCQSMFLEPGFFATFLELSIFATLAWAALTGDTGKKLVRWLLILQFGALLFTFASAGWFAIGSGLLVYIVLRLFVRPGVLSRSRVTVLLRTTAAIVGGTILLGLCFPSLALGFYNAIYVTKFVSDTTDVTSASDRLGKATDSIALFSQRPIFGWGSNQLPIISAEGASVGNAFLTVSTELGLVGLAIYSVMLCAIFWTLIQNIILAYRLQNAAYNGLTAALAGCVIASFIHSMFVDTEWLFSYWIALAFLYLNKRLLLAQFKLRDAEQAAG
jgi:hypothetical protein